MKGYEHITTSDHIRFEAFTHAAFSKGDLVTIGAITGTADINFAANEAVEIDVGVPRAVFRAATADVDGTPEVGANIYLDDGALTMDDESGVLYGVITDTNGAVAFVKVGV
jgi:predicted RecA/RadA family phage recombinase